MTARERGKCECSLMAKLELPKLASWVRFPSLAPKPTIFRRLKERGRLVAVPNLLRSDLSSVVRTFAPLFHRSGDQHRCGDDACRIEIPTGEFLEDGVKYIVKTYTDDEDSASPTKVKAAAYVIEGGDVLRFDLMDRGGAAMQFIPATKENMKGIRKLSGKTIL